MAEFKDGKMPISEEEYYALKTLAGIIEAFDSYNERLKKRAKSIKNGWRDLKLIESVSNRLFKKLIDTVPEKKLGQFRKEIENTITTVFVKKGIGYKKNTEYTYVSAPALERLYEKIMGDECMLCERRGIDVRKCQLRKDLDMTYNWDMESIRCGECVYSGLNSPIIDVSEEE